MEFNFVIFPPAVLQSQDRAVETYGGVLVTWLTRCANRLSHGKQLKMLGKIQQTPSLKYQKSGKVVRNYEPTSKWRQIDEVASLRTFAELNLNFREQAISNVKTQSRAHSRGESNNVPPQIKLEWQGAKPSVYQWMRNNPPHTHTHNKTLRKVTLVLNGGGGTCLRDCKYNLV